MKSIGYFRIFFIYFFFFFFFFFFFLFVEEVLSGCSLSFSRFQSITVHFEQEQFLSRCLASDIANTIKLCKVPC